SSAALTSPATPPAPDPPPSIPHRRTSPRPSAILGSRFGVLAPAASSSTVTAVRTRSSCDRRASSRGTASGFASAISAATERSGCLLASAHRHRRRVDLREVPAAHLVPRDARTRGVVRPLLADGRPAERHLRDPREAGDHGGGAALPIEASDLRVR